jgi:hypothetical protein
MAGLMVIRPVEGGWEEVFTTQHQKEEGAVERRKQRWVGRVGQDVKIIGKETGLPKS